MLIPLVLYFRYLIGDRVTYADMMYIAAKEAARLTLRDSFNEQFEQEWAQSWPRSYDWHQRRKQTELWNAYRAVSKAFHNFLTD